MTIRLPVLGQLDFGWRRRMPLVLQFEASECGLACLAMLLNHHGTVTDLATLRARHGTVPQGMTLADLARIAQAEQLSVRAVRLGLRELAQLRLPCILHWDLGHFVVLTEIRRGRCLIADPATGTRWLDRKEVSARFSGIALELWPDSAFVPREQARPLSLRSLIGRVHGLWRAVRQVLAVSLLLELLALLSPLFMQWTVDHVIVSRDVGLLATLGIGFLLLLVIEQFMTAVRALMVQRVSTQLSVQWRSNVLGHLLRLPLDFFARRHLGDVMSRFGSIHSILRVLTGAFVEAALDGLLVLLALGLMWAYSPRLAGVALLSVTLYGLVRSLWYTPLKNATAERLVRSANEASHLLETIRGVRTIRLFSRQFERLSAWQTLMVADVNASLRIQRLDIFYRLVRRTLSGGFTLLIVWLGAHAVLAGELSVGMLLAFLAYRSQFDSRFTGLVNHYFDLRMLGLDAQRLADIVLTPPEASAGGPAPTPLHRPPRIGLSGLSFRYSEGGPAILDGLDLDITPGQAVALTGTSGCGKTTLVQVLLGVYAPQRGEIRIDGTPLPQFGLDAWRSVVGTVLQDDVLFAGSIADNIAFFSARPDRSLIEVCAKIAAIHDDIMKLPMAYQTLVGDMGTTLSGGQKQRVLLARALYRRPRVLLLDEATSQLDVTREAEVGRAIARLHLTRIIVAHRPQTLALVDRVIELQDGRIVRDETARQYAERTGSKPAVGKDPP
ncbi:peptidase domain-containing ABC transporter [Sphaerotilus microaerophilus]|uniref:Toxin transporter n=1 Tax=Sphaerotilus microaerophilus TaxID=2914710 RepID=A0ABM7YTS5_9BURK|nr:peptidase domain-containing ABC transporter [Sphaerotilus sp. FB-5]BDI08049.1 toxin transporter [Sphaerotilus sp. FB-5]